MKKINRVLNKILSSQLLGTTLVILTLVDLSVSTSDTSNNITRITFGGIRDALPAAYGDFNSDELTDIFILTGEQQTVQILYGSTDSDQLVSDFKSFGLKRKNLKFLLISVQTGLTMSVYRVRRE